MFKYEELYLHKFYLGKTEKLCMLILLAAKIWPKEHDRYEASLQGHQFIMGNDVVSLVLWCSQFLMQISAMMSSSYF